MNSTTISADDALRFARTENQSTTAFDQDTCQRKQDFFRRPSFRWQSMVSHHSVIRSSIVSGIDDAKLAVGQWVALDTGSDQASLATEFAVPRYVSRPLSRYFAGLLQLSDRALKTLRAYHVRIEELKGDADEEGVVFSDASELDFWEFIISMPYARNAELVVTDNGNLRAVWRGEEDKHVGLQFLGGRWIEYVMWTRRTGALKISPKAGRDTFDGVKEQIRASRLTSFLQ